MKSSFLKLVASRYPKRKMLHHSGDSYLIYEAGNRSTDYPPDMKDLIDETEGKEADSGIVFEVDPRNLRRGGGYPGDDQSTQEPHAPDTGYPNASWMRKVLSRYDVRGGGCSNT